MSAQQSTKQPDTRDLPAQLAALQQSRTRLCQALTQFGMFFEAAREADPLPLLRELALDILHADDLHIAVPSGIGPAQSDDPQVLIQSVTVRGRAIGRFEARRATPFTGDDRALAFAIGQLIGMVLEQSSLHSQIEQYHLQTQAQTDTLDRLLDFERRVVSGLESPEQVALTLATLVPEMVSCDRASLLLVPTDSDAPQLVLSNGTIAPPERAQEVREGGLAGMVFRERRPIIIDETETDRRWMALERYDDAPSRCAMSAPLMWGSQILGVLTVTTTQSRIFNTSHLNLLELIAHSISLVLYTATFKIRLEEIKTEFIDVIHTLNNTIQAVNVGVQQLLPESSDESHVTVELRDLHNIVATLEELNGVSHFVNRAHQRLIALMAAAPQQPDDLDMPL